MGVGRAHDANDTDFGVTAIVSAGVGSVSSVRPVRASYDAMCKTGAVRRLSDLVDVVAGV